MEKLIIYTNPLIASLPYSKTLGDIVSNFVGTDEVSMFRNSVNYFFNSDYIHNIVKGEFSNDRYKGYLEGLALAEMTDVVMSNLSYFVNPAVQVLIQDSEGWWEEMMLTNFGKVKFTFLDIPYNAYRQMCAGVYDPQNIIDEQTYNSYNDNIKAIVGQLSNMNINTQQSNELH